MQFFHQWKNIILAVSLISLMAGIALPILGSIGPLQLFGAKKAQAQWVTIGDIPSMIKYVIEVVKEYWRDYIYPALRDLAAKKLMDYITQQTLDWVNNGTEPTFVGNWSKFMNDAGNIAFDSVNTYLNDTGIDLCTPFAPQVSLMLRGAYASPQLPVRCSVEGFRQNLSNSKNFVQSGGWLSYNQAFMPDGNLVGMYVNSENTLIGRAASQKAARVNEAISSSGFLGQKKECVKYSDGYNSDVIAQNCSTDSDPAACVAYATQENCVSWEARTPGDVVGKAVGNAITSDTQWSANIQNFVSAVFNALVTKVFQTGLSSLTSRESQISDYTPNSNPNSTRQLNSSKNQIATFYEDTLYYFNSDDYPVLETLNQIVSVARLGESDCVNSGVWSRRLTDAESVVNGMQTMLNEAQTNLDEINAIDPNADSDTITTALQDITQTFNDFQTTYQSLISDIQKAKQMGTMTDTEKSARQQLRSYQSELIRCSESGL